MGAHYAGDRVFVGFVDGNVERPYVLGAISKGAGADIHCTTPGGHQLKISDDDEGVRAFLTSMFLPMWGTWGDFIPNFGGKNPFDGTKNNLALAGGFELSDNFGIYKISGSTDSREINIQSPWGNVGISAFTGISISAPNGDISIKGKNISIEAGNNLNIVSGKNVDYKLWKEKDTIRLKEVCNKPFADLYKGLINDLWAMKDKYEPFDEAKLDFSDNMKSDENNPRDSVGDACHDRHGTLAMFKHPFKVDYALRWRWC